MKKKETINTIKLLVLSIVLLFGFSFVNTLVGNQTVLAKYYVTDIIAPAPPQFPDFTLGMGTDTDGGIEDPNPPCMVFGGLWEEPTATPPAENAPSPINITDGTQKKVGCLKIGADESPLVQLDVAGTIWTDYLSVWETSYFGNDVFVGGFPAVADDNVDVAASGSIFANWGDDAIADINETIDGGVIQLEEVDIGKGGNIRVDGLRPTYQGLIADDYPTTVCVDSDGRLVTCDLVEEEVVPDFSFTDYYKIVYAQIDFYQGWKSCPAEYPKVISGGARCIPSSLELVESMPTKVTGGTGGNEPYFTEGTDFNAWHAKCNESGEDVYLQIWATCTK